MHRKLLGAMLMVASTTPTRAFARYPLFALSRVGDYSKLGRVTDISPLARRSPSRDLFKMFDDIDDLLSMRPSSMFATQMPNLMAMDVKESKDSYELIVDVPGVETKDIHLSLKDSTLTISVERESSKKDEGENFRRIERSSGVVTRSISLPEDVDVEKIEAENKNGVLKVVISKLAGAKKSDRKIEIKGGSS